MKINNYLRKIGYRPDLSDGILLKYEKALNNYLGDKQYDDFCRARDSAKNENDILEFVGPDLKLLKLILSGQITISTKILERIIDRLRLLNKAPKNLLDLGGAEGWASSFLNKSLNFNCPITVVDRNPVFKPSGEELLIINEDYGNFSPNNNFDLIISILGAPISGLDELFGVIDRSISVDGSALLGLRIPTPIEYASAIDLAGKYNLAFQVDECESIEVFGDSFPLIYLKRAKKPIDNNEKLMLVRKGFHNYSRTKRVFGYEAILLETLITEYETVVEEEKSWDNGDSFAITVLRKNGILYRKSSNSKGDLLIEYPVDIKDHFNNVDNQIRRFHKENLWNNSL